MTSITSFADGAKWEFRDGFVYRRNCEGTYLGAALSGFTIEYLCEMEAQSIATSLLFLEPLVVAPLSQSVEELEDEEDMWEDLEASLLPTVGKRGPIYKKKLPKYVAKAHKLPSTVHDVRLVKTDPETYRQEAAWEDTIADIMYDVEPGLYCYTYKDTLKMERQFRAKLQPDTHPTEKEIARTWVALKGDLMKQYTLQQDDSWDEEEDKWMDQIMEEERWGGPSFMLSRRSPFQG